MQLTVRPYVTAGVVVIGAGLIHVTPVAVPAIDQRPVVLAAAEVFSDLTESLDAVAGGMLPGLGDLDGAVIDVPSLAAAEATDLWQWLQDVWNNLPGIFIGLVFWAELLLAPIIMPVVNFFYSAWDWLADLLGLPQDAVAAATDGSAAAAAALGEGAGDVVSLLDAGSLDPGAFVGAMPDLDGLGELAASLIP